MKNSKLAALSIALISVGIAAEPMIPATPLKHKRSFSIIPDKVSVILSNKDTIEVEKETPKPHEENPKIDSTSSVMDVSNKDTQSNEPLFVKQWPPFYGDI